MSLPTSSSLGLLRRWVSSQGLEGVTRDIYIDRKPLISKLPTWKHPPESPGWDCTQRPPRGLGWRCFMVQSNRSQLLRKAGQTGVREPQRTPSQLTLKPQGRRELRNAITWFGIWPAHRGEMAQQSLHPSVCQTERVYTSFTMYRRSFQRPLWLALKSPQ